MEISGVDLYIVAYSPWGEGVQRKVQKQRRVRGVLPDYTTNADLIVLIVKPNKRGECWFSGKRLWQTPPHGIPYSNTVLLLLPPFNISAFDRNYREHATKFI